MTNQSADAWITEILQASTPTGYEEPVESELAKSLVETCVNNKSLSDRGIGPLFASAFDLLVSAKYYSALTHKGWFYCPVDTPRLFFHYTNCCPRDAIRNKFHFHPSSKPESGQIGAATSRLLLLFYKTIFNQEGREEEILKGTEPVDAVIVNKKKGKILFAEIKASPLVTLPVSVKAQRLTEEIDGKVVARAHAPVDNTTLFGTDLEIFVPRKEGNVWVERYYQIGRRRNAEDRFWGFRGLVALLKNNPEFVREYFTFWLECLKSYYPKANDSIFWLTNGCGAPNTLLNNWPKRRRGEGYETVSDSKTSVGMDRTDDIKKGVYQLLKLGSLGKPKSSKWDYKVGLISNIHAARHFDEYLESLKDIVWTLDGSGNAKKISDLPHDQAIYNLFDGIVALTSTLSRDDWIRTMFTYEE
jgi:hypothetical protein